MEDPLRCSSSPGKGTLLVFPPQVMPVSPYLAPSLLKAYLQENGWVAEQRDCNALFYDSVLAPESLARTACRLEERIADLEASPSLSHPEGYRLRQLTEGLGHAEYARRHIDEAKRVFRDAERFHVLDSYIWANEVVALGFRALSACWFPTELSFDGLRSRFGPFSARESRAFAESAEENPYLSFFEQIFLPTLDLWKYSLVGISVAFPDQVLPATTLSRLLKRHRPDLTVCLGGNFYSRLGEALGRDPTLFRDVDAIVVGEGELPLLRLNRALAQGDDFREIPGIASCRGGVFRLSPNLDLVAARDLPTPDFDGLDLTLYLTPEIILPLLTFKGCTYGRCTFCDHHINYAKVSGRPGEKVAADLQTLSQRYHVRCFNFVDEEMPPVHADGVARALLDRGLEGVRWMGYAIYREVWTRAHWERLYAAGCREILFGFESASPRVLEMMAKPMSLDNVRRITRDLNGVGIASRVNVIVGFPGETEEEAQETLGFFLDAREIFDVDGTLVAFHPFLLVRNAPLARSAVGQEIVRPAGDQPLRLHYSYDVESSTELRIRADGRRLIDQEGAFLLAREHSAILASTYQRSRGPIWRYHRFLYIVRSRDGATVPHGEDEARLEQEPVCRVVCTRFDLETLGRNSRDARQRCESYEFWSNFRSKTASAYEEMSRLSEPLRSGEPAVYLHLHALGASGRIVHQLSPLQAASEG